MGVGSSRQELSVFQDVALEDAALLRGRFVAPPDTGLPCPTLLAVSGGDHGDVAECFRAWLAERRGWQVLVPLKNVGPAWPHFFEEGGVEALVRLIKDLVANAGSERAALPHAVEGGRLHLLGYSNGAAAVLAAASLVPELVASLTLLAGFIPTVISDLQPLRQVSSIRSFVGANDRFHHDERLEDLKGFLQMYGIGSELTVMPRVGHFEIGRHLDVEVFWAGLEAARPAESREAAKLVGAATSETLTDQALGDSASSSEHRAAAPTEEAGIDASALGRLKVMGCILALLVSVLSMRQLYTAGA